jgi:hypothetical protein
MVFLMTAFTKRYQVVWGVTSCLAALNVMYVEYFVLAFTFAVLADMTITEQHILARVPEVKLIATLILNSLNVGVLDLLDIESRYFHDDFCDGQYLMYLIDELQMRVYLLPD